LINQASFKKILITAIIIISGVYFVLALAYKPIVSNDAISGFISLHNYLHGAGWNKILLTNHNLTVEPYPLTWWAPGQYQIPYCLSQILHVNIGAAICIMLYLSVLGGCIFYYQIFKWSGLSNQVVLVALLILLLQRFFNINFIQYSSPDLLLFFYVPFYIFVYLKIANSSRWFIPKLCLLVIINLGGLFIKNSFLLFAVAFNLFLLVEFVVIPYYKSKFRVKASLLLLPMVLAAALDYWLFLRHGNTPATGWGVFFNFWEVLQGAFAGLTGSLFSSLSVFALYGNVYRQINLWGVYANIAILIIFALIIAIAYLNRKGIKTTLTKDSIFRLAVIAIGMYTMFWIIFAVKKSAVGNEDRLFLPATILVLPYLINYALNKRRLKFAYLAILLFSVCYGSVTLLYRIRTYSQNKSAYSNNSQINGFKVFIKGRIDSKDLINASQIIEKQKDIQYIIIPDPNFSFLLNTTKKFIITDISMVSPSVINANFSLNKGRYILLLPAGKIVNKIIGWHAVYVSATVNLYSAD
jgi:hypothetical protein